MTEADWLAAIDPTPLLEFLRSQASDRKLRLFACACCWRIPDLHKRDGCRHAIESLEAAADGLISWDDCVAATSFASHAIWYELPIYQARKWWASDAAAFTTGAVARGQSGNAAEDELQVHACLIRCIVGNPFRPVAFDPEWRTETVSALATGIYVERAFDRLPILADALEEAGCDQPDILNHCRGPGPHARGCWAVDLVLGKS